MQWLPEYVLALAHILPSYWFMKTNELLKTLEVFNLDSMKPIIINMIVVLLFSLAFVVITNIITKKKRKIN